MTQHSMIIASLREGNTLTPLNALKDFGCFKLSTRIGEIISRGMLRDGERIVRKMVSEGDKNFMSYRLVREH